MMLSANTQKRFQQVLTRVKAGESVGDACKAAKLNASYFYKIRRDTAPKKIPTHTEKVLKSMTPTKKNVRVRVSADGMQIQGDPEVVASFIRTMNLI